jgi:glycerate 2-kinase
MIIDMLHKILSKDLLIVLLSGGGSSLVTALEKGISLEAIQALNRQLIHSGAKIQEINIVRKHFDRLKGGGVLKFVNGASVLTLLISDAIGNDVGTIASGLTALNDSTFSQAYQVLKKYHLARSVDSVMMDSLRVGLQKEQKEILEINSLRNLNVINQVVLSNRDCMEQGLEMAQ